MTHVLLCLHLLYGKKVYFIIANANPVTVNSPQMQWGRPYHCVAHPINFPLSTTSRREQDGCGRGQHCCVCRLTISIKWAQLQLYANHCLQCNSPGWQISEPTCHNLCSQKSNDDFRITGVFLPLSSFFVCFYRLMAPGHEGGSIVIHGTVKTIVTVISARIHFISTSPHQSVQYTVANSVQSSIQ